MEGQNFNVPEIPQEDSEKKPSKKSPIKSILAAGAILAAGVATMIQGEKHEEKEYKDNEVANSLNESHIGNKQEEATTESLFKNSLENYYLRLEEGKDPGFEGYNEWNIKDQNRARALEIAIKSGIVKPEIAGWKYLWDTIEYSDFGTARPPIDIHFGTVPIPLKEGLYTPSEWLKISILKTK